MSDKEHDPAVQPPTPAGPDDPLHETYLRGYLEMARARQETDASAAGVIRLLVSGVRELHRVEAAYGELVERVDAHVWRRGIEVDIYQPAQFRIVGSPVLFATRELAEAAYRDATGLHTGTEGSVIHADVQS